LPAARLAPESQPFNRSRVKSEPRIPIAIHREQKMGHLSIFATLQERENDGDMTEDFQEDRKLLLPVFLAMRCSTIVRLADIHFRFLIKRKPQLRG
jgi:hypothetical protein